MKRITLLAATAFFVVSVLASPGFAASGDVDDGFGVAGLAGDTVPSIKTEVPIVAAGSRLVLATASGPSLGVSGFDLNGVMDTNFGNSGGQSVTVPGAVDVRVNDASVDPDGNIVLVGTATFASAPSSMVAARFTVGGDVDTTFSGDGVAFVRFGGPSEGFGVAPGGGKLLLTGSAELNGRVHVSAAQLRPNGKLDRDFGNRGKVAIKMNNGLGPDNGAWRVLRVARGWLMTGWYGDPQGGDYETLVIKIQRSGALDPRFAKGGIKILRLDPAGEDWAYGIAKDGTRFVLAIAGNASAPGVARIRPDGSRDTSFTGDGFEAYPAAAFMARAIAVDSAGRYVLAGGSGQGLQALRVTSVGAIDASFGGDGFATNPGTTAVGFDLLLQGGQPVVSGAQVTTAAWATRYQP